MSSSSPVRAGPKALERRLLNDIAEIQQDPYPNIHLHFDDADIRTSCLVLTPEDQDPLHLTIFFDKDYPLHAPTVKIQSSVEHPNVFGNYICATMLNTTDGWTPAYTLKGIVIQLLSFFCSETLEQDHGGDDIDLAQFRRTVGNRRLRHGQQKLTADTYTCLRCGFGPQYGSLHYGNEDIDIDEPATISSDPFSIQYTTAKQKPTQKQSDLFSLPDEVMLLLFNSLQTSDILAFADAVPSIKNMVNSYDFIRIRELQCFCLKQSFMETKLGVGVAITGGKRPVFRSEFDLLSQDAFYQHGVRQSIQGVRFDKWLPLPLSPRHWNLVKTNAAACLAGIHKAGKMDSTQPSDVDVLYHFMNTVVVQFSNDAERSYHGPDHRSTLSHASEKAVEAYFGLYHLLLCLATEDPSIVAGANRITSRFMTGPRTKKQFPDLGHVLVASLISDDGLTEELTFLVIKEAILRNVVWMLDTKGAGFAELAYLEPSSVSEYRLVNTFAASPTSYRLLMFLKLFSSSARPAGKTLVQLRDALFETHGAPPPGISAEMADRIRKILRERYVEVAKGVEISPELERWFQRGEKWYNNGWRGRPSFFPGGNKAQYMQVNDPYQGRGGGRGGRGGGTGDRGRGGYGRGRARGG
ncbi:hypothetical protein DE146DRAFT_676071 [Phaeosphaeria sp. MPI-PUGE-AT-0046c]|nr:hypothetical protein DE146DRAFT_676071 [Phaeosphaeria sp. MPI-PUGE-AT-0046c]